MHTDNKIKNLIKSFFYIKLIYLPKNNLFTSNKIRIIKMCILIRTISHSFNLNIHLIHIPLQNNSTSKSRSIQIISITKLRHRNIFQIMSRNFISPSIINKLYLKITIQYDIGCIADHKPAALLVFLSHCTLQTLLYTLSQLELLLDTWLQGETHRRSRRLSESFRQIF